MGAGSVFKDEDRKLLQTVFNPAMTDRHHEGDRFVPPDSSFTYVQKLRSLVKEEELVREKRVHIFLDTEFSTSTPGVLFPSNWMPSFEIAHGRGKVPEATAQGGKLRARPDYRKEE